jgi:hypothetical protein
MRHRIIVILALLAVAGAAFASGASEEDRFASLGIDSISVKTEFLDVEIQADDRLGVSMRENLPADSLFGSRGYRVLHEMTGSRLNVWVEKDTPFFSRGRGKLFFRVPRDARIRVETVSGNISLDAVEGRILARTVSGAIKGRDIAFTGDSSFSTISGNVELRLTPLSTIFASIFRPFPEESLSATSGPRRGCGWDSAGPRSGGTRYPDL